MNRKAKLCSVAFFGITAVAAALGFVAFPGCATPPGAPSQDTFSPREHAYGHALRAIEKKKRRGDLPGVEAPAAGKFSGTWLWYDDSQDGGHVIRFVFRFSDGRPPREFEAVYAKGWQVSPAQGL